MTPSEYARYGFAFLAHAATPSSPRILYIEVTKRCNAFCSFCPYWQDHRRGELDDYSPIVRQLRPFCVTFTGGEPLLRRELPSIVAKVTALQPRPYTAVLTNGWLLSRERAQALRDAGCEQISISLDHVGARHDERRGLPGLFARLEHDMPALRTIGFDRINLNTIVMRSNLDELVPLAKLAHAWGVTISFSAYSPMKTKSDDELFRDEDVTRLTDVVAELRALKLDGHVITSHYWFDHVVDYFRNGGRVGARCTAAGSAFMHVDPWGHMKICPEFEPFAHWTELDEKRPPAHDCTRCWYGCRGENEAPLTIGRIGELLFPASALLQRARNMTREGRAL
ncbi:MAG TPA: radical SAM protein [Polyangia bacterium]